MATDLRGLNSFKEKLQKYKNLNADFNNAIIEEVCSEGVKIAQSQYSDVSNVKVWYEKTGMGSARIIASKEGLAYIEFGTGDVGKESNYPDSNLPQEGIPITGAWTYYYEPSDHKTTKDGKRGWMWGSQFVVGRPAGMQMYKTSQQLKQKFKRIVKKRLKGDKASV